MAHEFDTGPVEEPFASLVADYPGEDVYPSDDFRVEWGPIFHRGRLDGSARVLVVGQDPATAETIARRILVGEAGHRVQGFLAKLGYERSYVMVNTFLYSVFGQGGGERHKNDDKIRGYRERWFQAVVERSQIEVVVALGHLADDAWKAFISAHGESVGIPFQHITHPTQPESSSGGDRTKLAEATKKLLENWNGALQALAPSVKHPDATHEAVPYGDDFGPGDRLEIPEVDLPAGLPAWMRSPHAWATRTGDDPDEKRRTITVKVPSSA